MEVAASIAYSLIYLLSVLAIARCLKGLPFLASMPFALLLVLGINAVGFVLLGLVGVGYSVPISVSFNLLAILVGTCLGGRVRFVGRNAVLKAIATKYDVIAWVVLGLIALTLFLVRYGMPPQLLFVSGDAATHYELSRTLFEGGVAKSQCCTYLFAAMLMSSLSGFFGSDSLAALFVVSEVVIFYLGGLCFYCFVSQCSFKANKFGLNLLLSVLYMCGMPMNSLILGFSYLSFSVVAITGVLLFLVRVQEGAGRLFEYASLSLLLFEVVISYSLFVPAVYIGVFVALMVIARRKRDTWKMIARNMAIVFVVPVLLGCILVYLSYFGKTGTAGVGVALSRDGGTFVETYGQYLIFLPLIMYGAYCAFRRKQMSSVNVVFAIFLAFTLVLGAFSIIDRVSPYYFSKTSNVLWLGAFIYIACAFDNLLGKSKVLVASFVASYLLMLGLFVSGIDSKVVEREYNTETIGDSVFPIYAQNKAWLHTGNPREELIEAYDVLNSYSLSGGDDGGDATIGVLNHGDTPSRWFQAFYGSNNVIAHWGYEDEALFDAIKQRDYVFVGSGKGGFDTASGTSYDDLRESILSSGIGEVVFSNASGDILKINR